MILSKYDHTSYFGIFEPRYHDKTVLLACHKIQIHNKIVFLKAPSMGSGSYYISGERAKKCPKGSNTSLACYVVPLSELEPLEIEERDLKEVI